MINIISLGICGWVAIVFVTATVILAIFVDRKLYEKIVFISECIWLAIAVLSLFMGTPFTIGGFFGGALTWLTLGSMVYDVMAVVRLGNMMSQTIQHREEVPLQVVYGEPVEDEEEETFQTPRLHSGR